MPRPDSISLEEYRRLVGLPTTEQVARQDAKAKAASAAPKPVDPPGHLVRLMEIPRLSMPLKNEQALSQAVANMMRAATLVGSYRGVWTHIANEGKRSRLVGAVLKAMGLVPGATDFVFAWHCGSGLIELKVPPFRPSDLSQSQKDYQKWCIESAVNHAVCTTSHEVWRALMAWGAVRQPLTDASHDRDSTQQETGS